MDTAMEALGRGFGLIGCLRQGSKKVLWVRVEGSMMRAMSEVLKPGAGGLHVMRGIVLEYEV
jgi:hypothetical protein